MKFWQSTAALAALAVGIAAPAFAAGGTVSYVCQQGKQVDVSYQFNSRGKPVSASARLSGSNRNMTFDARHSDSTGTAFKDSAGYNLVASSKRNGRRIVSIVVGTDSTEARASESGKLLNWALQAFDTPKLYNGGEIISKVKVYKGSSKSVNVGFLEDVYITIPHDAGQNIKPILETVQPVIAPIRKGQTLGKLKIVKDGKVITEKNVVALHSVEEGSWFRRMWDDIVLWFKGLFGSSSK